MVVSVIESSAMKAVAMPSGLDEIAKIADYFGKGASTYLPAALLQQQVATDLMAFLPTSSDVLLDLGCGPGWLHPQLGLKCRQLWALDVSAPMLQQAKAQAVASRYMQADAACIPLPDHSVDTVFSSLMLQWCPQPAAVMQELQRILKPGGRIVLATLAAGSLVEFSQSWEQVDAARHHIDFLSVARLQTELSHSLLQAEFSQHGYQLHYPDVFSLSRSFQQIGANYVAARAKGLTGKQRWQQFANAYERLRTPAGLPLSYQVLIWQATKRLA